MAFNPNALDADAYREAQQKYLAPDYDAVREALAVAQARAEMEAAQSRPRRSGRKASSKPASPVADMALGSIVADAMQKAAEQRQIEKRGINEDVPLRTSHTPYVEDTSFKDYISNLDTIEHDENETYILPEQNDGTLPNILEGLGTVATALTAPFSFPFGRDLIKHFAMKKSINEIARLGGKNSKALPSGGQSGPTIPMQTSSTSIPPIPIGSMSKEDALRLAIENAKRRDLTQQGISVSPKSGGLPPYVNKNNRDLFFDILGFGI